MIRRTAQSLLFGPRRAARPTFSPSGAAGRVHHVSYVIREGDYWSTLTYLANGDKLSDYSDLSNIFDSRRAGQVITDLGQWGWLENFDGGWKLTQQGNLAVTAQILKNSELQN